MARRQQAGLDELMIVNPGSPDRTRAVTLRRIRTAHRASGVTADDRPEGQGFGREDEATGGRYFLGGDGALYELIE